jgi:hypothetical protein
MKTFAVVTLATSLLFSGCTVRLTDFTAISSKNVQLSGITKGKKVEGDSCGFLGIGADIKTALDRAIESGGDFDGDMLIDGVVTMSDYFLVHCYRVILAV